MNREQIDKIQINRKQLDQLIAATNETYRGVSNELWDFAETKFQESKSAELLWNTLEACGFQIESNLAEMGTAFVASFGEGYPVIGILGEYDALPGLSQACDVNEKSPLPGKDAGHGCGHNLLGASGAQAAAVLKAYLEKNHMPGTIRYYGCPAEETGAGKAFMVRAGCFDDVDVCIAWHPGSINAYNATTSANIHVYYTFHGTAAHAAAAPELGRSALDAAELMNVGVNFLREHVTPDVRMQYAFTNAGGVAPNIVQSEAQMIYAVRADSISKTDQVYQRVNKIARGAAMMTETEVEIHPVSAYANVLYNNTLSSLIIKYMDLLVPTEEIVKHVSAPISTDVGDVSWQAPTVCFYMATATPGTQLHSWQMTAQGKSCRAYEGMERAVKLMSYMAVSLFENHDLIDQAKSDLKKEKGSDEYKSLIPDHVKPGEK